MKKRIITTLAIGLSIMVILAGISSRTSGISASNGIPQLINYQGKLTDSSGESLTGDFSMTFAMYDSEVGGNLLWEEGPRDVTVNEGLFSVLLGEVNPIPLEVFDGDSVWMEVTVEGEKMDKRKRIASGGFAFYALKAGDADTVDGLHASEIGLWRDADTYIYPVNVGTDFQITDTGNLTVSGGVHIKGEQIKLEGDSPYLMFARSGNNKGYIQWLNHQDTLYYSSTGTHSFVNGNVGIGTTSPTAGLTINDDADRGLQVSSGFGNPSGGFGLELKGSSTTTEILAYDRGTSNYLPLNLRGNPIILNNGNVGIGTTSPGAKLQVGSGKHSGEQKVLISGDNSILVVGHEEEDNPIILLHAYGATDYSPEFVLYRQGYSRFAIRSNGVSGETSNDRLEIAEGDNVLVAIKETGNVGIGTTSPSAKLHISGPGDEKIIISAGSDAHLQLKELFEIRTGGNDDFEIWDLDSSNNILAWDDSENEWEINGNVGIGTASPATNLHVYGGASNKIRSDATSWPGFEAYNGAQLVLSLFGAGSTGHSYLDTWNDMHFRPGGSESVVFRTNGNVGIGTTNPQSELSVNGTITAKEVIVTLDGWPDFVFEDDYKPTPISELEQSIKKNKHLPGIPSAEEVAANGVNVGEMQAKLLQKIEELTLYMIDLKKENEMLKKRVSSLEHALEPTNN